MRVTLVSLLGLCIFTTSFVLAQTTYSNIDDIQKYAPPTGWGSCTSCAGGANTVDSYWMALNQTTPSLDGASTEFHMTASKQWADVLFWNKLGPNTSATHFTWSFYFRVSSSSTNLAALEFDIFQFIVPVEYMFGSQCTYTTGYWDVWNASTHKWVQTSLGCTKFTTNTWHHIVWNVHRTTTDNKMHYDSLTIDGVQHTLNIAEPSGALPSGWSNMMGVQWQLDGPGNLNLLPITANEWIDKVSLKVW
jgi:hypothetical protein